MAAHNSFMKAAMRPVSSVKNFLRNSADNSIKYKAEPDRKHLLYIPFVVSTDENGEESRNIIAIDAKVHGLTPGADKYEAYICQMGLEAKDDDGNITPEDRDIIGNPFPKYSYSFNLGASWKNFDLSTFWQGVGGIYRYSWETSTDIRGNLTNRWVNRYSADNINAPMPALGNTMNDSYSSFWLEKSDYLRLKNLEFGYTFRQTELAKVGISSIRVYFAGSNLLTFTPLKNWDPEKSSGDTRNDVHPNMRTYSFGLNIQF